MKKTILVLLVMVFVASCKESAFIFKPSHRRIIEQSKVDLKSIQFYSPRKKIIFVGGAETNMKQLDNECKIKNVKKFIRNRIKLGSKMKMACAKVDGDDLYMVIDKAYSPLVFRESPQGYFLVTDPDGFVVINGKEYWTKGSFFLRIKGKIFRKSNTYHVRVKGVPVECK